jgi:serine protease
MRHAAPLIVVVLALSALPASAAAQPTGRVVVVLSEPADGAGARASGAKAVASRAGALRGPTVPRLGVLALRPRGGESPGELAARVRRDPAVRTARPEQRARPRYLPNDPSLSTHEPAPGLPAGTPVQWTIARQNLPRAWDIAQGPRSLVGVVDTGIDVEHPDFDGKIVRAVDQGGGPPDRDDDGHGTHVASQACARADNGVGLVGTGYGCKIILERSDFSETSIARSIVDAVVHGAQAINMSFGSEPGSPQSEAVQAAVDFAADRGVVLVAAAAATPVEEQGWPANMLQPTGTGEDLDAGKGLSVTSANFFDERSSFAGRGTQISLAAYGSVGTGSPAGIFGAFPANVTDIEKGRLGPPPIPACKDCRTTFGADRRYAYLKGTSMAAPQVTGVAAIIKNLNPDLRLDDILRILKRTASNESWEPELGWGIVNAGAAVEAAQKLDRTKPVSRTRAPRTTSRSRFTARWSGFDPAPPGLEASGVRFYEVYREIDDGPYRRVARTKRRSIRLRTRPGARYRLYTLATDRAGNREEAPERADAITRVPRD